MKNLIVILACLYSSLVFGLNIISMDDDPKKYGESYSTHEIIDAKGNVKLERIVLNTPEDCRYTILQSKAASFMKQIERAQTSKERQAIFSEAMDFLDHVGYTDNVDIAQSKAFWERELKKRTNIYNLYPEHIIKIGKFLRLIPNYVWIYKD